MVSNLGKHANELADQITSILVGNPPEMIGAALCELTARWLAGHVAENADITNELRSVLLKQHIEHICELTIRAAKTLGTDHAHDFYFGPRSRLH